MSKEESATPNRCIFIIIGCTAEILEKLAQYLERLEYFGTIQKIIMMARKKSFYCLQFFPLAILRIGQNDRKSPESLLHGPS